MIPTNGDKEVRQKRGNNGWAKVGFEWVEVEGGSGKGWAKVIA